MTNEKKHPEIALTPIKSSQLAAIGHDPLTNTLAIQFKSKSKSSTGSIYHYQNFTTEHFNEFKNAESFGSHFKQKIKSEVEKHPYVKVS